MTLGERLYSKLMYTLLDVGETESHTLWLSLPIQGKEIWEGVSSSYMEIVGSYNCKLSLPKNPLHLAQGKEFAKSIFHNQMKTLFHCNDAQIAEIWNNISAMDKKLMLLMTCGIDESIDESIASVA